MAAGSVEVASPTASPALVRIGAVWSRRRPRPDRRRARRPARRRRRGGRRPRPPAGAGADGARRGASGVGAVASDSAAAAAMRATTRCSNPAESSASGTRRRISSAASVSSVSSRQHARRVSTWSSAAAAPRRRGCRAPARRRRSRTRYRTWCSSGSHPQLVSEPAQPSRIGSWPCPAGRCVAWLALGRSARRRHRGKGFSLLDGQRSHRGEDGRRASDRRSPRRCPAAAPATRRWRSPRPRSPSAGPTPHPVDRHVPGDSEQPARHRPTAGRSSPRSAKPSRARPAPPPRRRRVDVISVARPMTRCWKRRTKAPAASGSPVANPARGPRRARSTPPIPVESRPRISGGENPLAGAGVHRACRPPPPPSPPSAPAPPGPRARSGAAHRMLAAACGSGLLARAAAPARPSPSGFRRPTAPRSAARSASSRRQLPHRRPGHRPRPRAPVLRRQPRAGQYGIAYAKTFTVTGLTPARMRSRPSWPTPTTAPPTPHSQPITVTVSNSAASGATGGTTSTTNDGY